MSRQRHESFYDYNAEYFNAGMRGWHAVSFGPITEQFEAWVPGKKLGDILDYGCGDGFYGPYLRRRAVRLDGVDYATAFIQKDFQNTYDNVFQADLGLPWQHPHGHTYDILFSTEVIEHIIDYNQFLANAFALLRPNGKLVLTTTTYAFTIFVLLIAYRRRVSFSSLREYVVGWWDEGSRCKFVEQFAAYTGGHHHGFTLSQLRKAMRKNGFRVERLSYLFAQDVVHLHHLDQPYHGNFSGMVRGLIPFVRTTGKLINSFCSRTRCYAPNVMLTARRSVK